MDALTTTNVVIAVVFFWLGYAYRAVWVRIDNWFLNAVHISSEVE